MDITTEYVRPPVPSKQYDWMACVQGEEDSLPIGRGPTEAEALRDLAEQLAVKLTEQQVQGMDSTMGGL